MKIRDLRNKSFENYKKHPLNSWVLSLICALFIAALTLIALVSESLVLILIPVLILPFFFACILTHLSLREKDELSGGTLFGFFKLFFISPFYSSFSAIKSFLKSLLIGFIASIASTGICYAIYSQSETFMITINGLMEQLKDMSITYEQFQAYLEANGNELSNFIDLSNSINFLTFAFSFIFFILREEITIYARINLKNVPLAGQIARASIRANSKNFNKYYFALNWPFLAILLAGMIGGVTLSITVFNNYAISGAVGLSLGIALTAVFLPFYFSNQEVIFEQLSIDIGSFSEEYIKGVFNKYGVEVQIKEHDTQEEVDGVKKDPDDTESK